MLRFVVRGGPKRAFAGVLVLPTAVTIAEGEEGRSSARAAIRRQTKPTYSPNEDNPELRDCWIIDDIPRLPEFWHSKMSVACYRTS